MKNFQSASPFRAGTFFRSCVILGILSLGAAASFAQTSSVTYGQNEDATFSAVGTVCPQLAALSREEVLTDPDQIDLFIRCGEVLQDSDFDRRQRALNQMGREEVSVTGSTTTETTQVQLLNIQQRITALRSMALADAGIAGGDAMALARSALSGSQNPTPALAKPIAAVGGGQGAGSAAAAASRYGWFINGEYSTAERDATSLESGYDLDGYDITIGFDSGFKKTSFFGLAAGFKSAEADLKNQGGTLDAEGYSLALYGGAGGDGVFFDYTVGYAANDFESSVAISYTILERASNSPRGFTTVNQVAAGETDGDELLGSFTLGYATGSGSFSFQPFIRGTYTDTSIDGYEERMLNPGNGSGLALRVEDQSIESLVGSVGATISWNLSTNFGVLVPTVSAEWNHEFEDDARVINTRFVNEAANPNNDDAKNLRVFTDLPDEDFYSVSAGLNFVFVGGTQFYLLYNTILDLDNTDYHGGTVGIRFEI